MCVFVFIFVFVCVGVHVHTRVHACVQVRVRHDPFSCVARHTFTCNDTLSQVLRDAVTCVPGLSRRRDMPIACLHQAHLQ